MEERDTSAVSMKDRGKKKKVTIGLAQDGPQFKNKSKILDVRTHCCWVQRNFQ